MVINNIPNILTFLRIAIIPIIVGSFYFDDKVLAHRIAATLFLFAGMTDFFDGYLARKYDAQSEFGKMLDPLADKLLVSSILLMLAKFRKVSEIPCLIILTREFIVAGLREYLSLQKVVLPVSSLAKLKTAAQFLAFFLLLLGAQGSGIKAVNFLGKFTLWFASALTVITGYVYLTTTINYMRQIK